MRAALTTLILLLGLSIGSGADRAPSRVSITFTVQATDPAKSGAPVQNVRFMVFVLQDQVSRALIEPSDKAYTTDKTGRVVIPLPPDVNFVIVLQPRDGKYVPCITNELVTPREDSISLPFAIDTIESYKSKIAAGKAPQLGKQLELLLKSLKKGSNEAKEIQDLIASLEPRQTAKRLGKDDESLMWRCVDAVLACGMKRGGVRRVAYQLKGQPADIEPYFNDLACCGVLAACEYDRSNGERTKRAFAFVKNWLEWHAKNAPTPIMIFGGKYDPKTEEWSEAPVISDPDSHDSYAAMYLTLANRYRNVTGTPLSPSVLGYCRKCLDVLRQCHDKQDGFYWVYIEGAGRAGSVRTKYLSDNIEVAQGLLAAGDIFANTGDKGDVELAKLASASATELGEKLGAFWTAPAGHLPYFACQASDKAAGIPFGGQGVKGDGLANCAAITWLEFPRDSKLDVWNNLEGKFGEDIRKMVQAEPFHDESPAIERVYMAAAQANTDIANKTWLPLLRSRAKAFLERTKLLKDPKQAGLGYPRVERYGLMVLGLLSQLDPPIGQLPTIRITLSP